jgi:hypothetical protein
MIQRESLVKVKELLPKLGNLSRLKDQIALFEEARAELLTTRDLDSLLKQITDLGPKLDALGGVIECIKTW